MTPVFSAFTMFLGITFPFFSDLLSFFGGFAFAPTTYFVSSHWSIIHCFYYNYNNELFWFKNYSLRAEQSFLVSASFPALCGSQSTNPEGSASHGSLTGWEQLTMQTLVSHLKLLSSNLLVLSILFRSALFLECCWWYWLRLEDSGTSL